MSESLPKRLLRAGFNAYRKYISEVGYVTRFFNYHYSRYSQRHEIIRRRRLAAQAQVAPSLQPLLDRLRSDGGAKASLSSFCDAGALLGALQAKQSAIGEKTQEEIRVLRQGQSKTYWTNFFDVNDPAFAPLMDVLVHRDLLAVIAAYLQEVPLLMSVHFYYSPPGGDPARLIGSQGWHLDNEQRSKVKLFLSPHAMTMQNGPTTFLPAPFSDHGKYKNYPAYFDDEQAAAFGIDTAKRVPMLAAEGEFFLADTSRLFHYGARN